MLLTWQQASHSLSLYNQGRNREAGVPLATDMGCLGRRALDLRALKALMTNSNHFLEALRTLKPFTCALFSQFWAIFYPLDREKSHFNF